MSRAERRARVAAGSESAGVDALLVTSPVNVRYLTAVHSSNAALVVAPGSCVLVTDARYAEAAQRLCPDADIVLERDALGGAITAAVALGATRLGFESQYVSVAEAARAETLAVEAGAVLVPLTGLVEAQRLVKDPGEVELLRAACAASERALARLLPEIAVGATERAIAARLEFLMRDEGAEAAGFPSIVAAGACSSEPHHEPSPSALAAGDFLKVDFGARWEGYHADMTRTFVVGAAAAAWQSEIHAVVAEAAAAGRAAVHPGVLLVDVDRAAREVVETAGWGDFFAHGLGHGVGLEIHEAPMIGPKGVGTLAENMTVTIEPGIYLPGRGGVRIEDTVLVTAEGAVPLTTMNRELLVLG